MSNTVHRLRFVRQVEQSIDFEILANSHLGGAVTLAEAGIIIGGDA